MNQPNRRLVFITGQLGLGGAEKQLALLATGLASRGWKVGVITLNGGSQDYWEEPLQRTGIPVFSIPATTSRVSRIGAIRKILRMEQPDIVHSWTIYANIYAAIAGRLSNTRRRIGSERANHHSSRRDIGDFWYSQSLRGLDALVTNSRPEAEYLRAFRPTLKTFVVSNGVEVPDFPPEHQRRKQKQEIGLADDSVVVGAVGSLVPRKNFSMLIAALAALGRKNSNLHLVMIGDGPLRQKLYNEATQVLPSGNVHFLGAQPNASSLFPVFDIFCFPSTDQEGMPNVLMEAASWGIPTVATNVGSVFEVVEDGKTGFIVDADDPKQMAERIELLLVNRPLRKTMGEAGRTKMQKEFSVDRMVTNMEEVYRAIA